MVVNTYGTLEALKIKGGKAWSITEQCHWHEMVPGGCEGVVWLGCGTVELLSDLADWVLRKLSGA